MTKWFEEVANDASISFPAGCVCLGTGKNINFRAVWSRMRARTMIARLKQNFRDLGDRDGQFMNMKIWN